MSFLEQFLMVITKESLSDCSKLQAEGKSAPVTTLLGRMVVNALKCLGMLALILIIFTIIMLAIISGC